MGRRARVDFKGAWHHVMNRGGGRRDIFRTDDECVAFMALLGKTVDRLGVEVHAYSLMPNHFHLLVRSVHGNLSRAMQYLQGQFTMLINRQHETDGPAFRGRYANQPVTEESHLQVLLPYIHLNPVRAGLIRTPEEDYAWTSHRAYVRKESAPAWLTRKTLLERFGSAEQLHRHVLGYHQGRIEWPSDFDRDTGLFEVGPYSAHDGDQTSKASPERVLAIVSEVSGVDLATIKTASYGRGANPARRFASWALLRHTELRHADIGELLAMSQFQVSKSAQRFRDRGLSAPLDKWSQLLVEKVSSVSA